MVAGLVHAAWTFYWMAGGTALVSTLGAWAVEWSERDPVGARAVLGVIGLVKTGGAVLPWAGTTNRVPGRRWWRGLAWPGAVLLVVYGGLSTAVAGWVLATGRADDADVDRPALIGHALLWDPLFLLWGSALLIGLLLSRRAHDRVADGGRSRDIAGAGA